MTRPASGAIWPISVRRSVVLPPPFGPIRPMRSPRRTSISLTRTRTSRAAAILVADSQLIGCQRDLARLDLRAHAELDRRVHRRAFDALQAVELLLAATRLFAALPSLVATDELLGMRDVFLLRLVLLRPALHPLGAQLHVVRVVAGIQLGALVGDLDSTCGHAVEEVAVVRDDDERARPVEQVLLKPFQRGEVEVVRRLVEQKQIGLLAAAVCRGRRASAGRR